MCAHVCAYVCVVCVYAHSRAQLRDTHAEVRIEYCMSSSVIFLKVFSAFLFEIGSFTGLEQFSSLKSQQPLVPTFPALRLQVLAPGPDLCTWMLGILT